jgi:hypothetical protein
MSREKTWKEMSEKERLFMRDKFGLPLNKAIQSKKTKKYGALAQY